MKTGAKIGLGLAAALAGYATYKALSEAETKEPAQVRFEQFLDDRITVDHLNGPVVADWFKATGIRGDGETLWLLARPTKRTLERFNITGCPVEIDESTNLLQFTVDKSTGRVAHARLIGFCTMSETLERSLAGRDYVLFREDAE